MVRSHLIVDRIYTWSLVSIITLSLSAQIWLQVLCFMIGRLSLFLVQKSKQMGASLFDLQKAAKSAPPQDSAIIEQEMAPLTTYDDSMDVGKSFTVL